MGEKNPLSSILHFIVLLLYTLKKERLTYLLVNACVLLRSMSAKSGIQNGAMLKTSKRRLSAGSGGRVVIMQCDVFEQQSLSKAFHRSIAFCLFYIIEKILKNDIIDR